MRASTKTILFSRVTVDKTVKRHIVAVFGSEADAKSYAGLIALAHKSGNTELAVSLDEHTVLTDDKALVPGLKFDLVSARYNPSTADSADDMFAES